MLKTTGRRIGSVGNDCVDDYMVILYKNMHHL